MFTLIFFSRLPPPTEKINNKSFELRLLTLSQFRYAVSHPSSFTLAVSSETLSVGA